MTISSETRKAGPYIGTGVTVAFPFEFKVFAAGDLLVVHTTPGGVENALTLGADYSVVLNANQEANPGGVVTMFTALLAAHLLTIASVVKNMQPVTLTNQGGFYPKVINDALDRVTILIQQLAEKVSRAITVNISSSITPDALVAEIVSAVGTSTAAAAAASAAADIAVAAAATISLPIPVASGGTGATTSTASRVALGVAQGRDAAGFGALQVAGVDAVKFTAQGIIPLAGQSPAFSEGISGAQSIPNATWTKVTPAAEEYDTSNAYDNSTLFRFVAPAPGVYHFSGAVSFPVTVAGQVLRAAFYKNGAAVKYGPQVQAVNVAGTGAAVSADIKLLTGDYVELWAYQNAGVSLNTDVTSALVYFQGFLARPEG